MSKANYINKRLVKDWISLQNWLRERRLDGRDEWDNRCHEMDSHEMAEHQGYYRAINDTIDVLTVLMSKCPELDAQRPYRNSSSTKT